MTLTEAREIIERNNGLPTWHLTEADEALGKAFRSLHSFKGALDKFEEIPHTLTKFYKDVSTQAAAIGKIRQDVYNTRMNAIRYRRLG